MRSPSPDKTSISEPAYNLKPRSILIDKQYTSEPSSPICPDKHPKKVMLRNHSDLGSRIRKRVTYRLHSVPVRNFGEPVTYNDSNVMNTVQNDCSEDKSDGNGDIHRSASSLRSSSKEDIAEEVFVSDSFEDNSTDIAHDTCINQNTEHSQNASFPENIECTNYNQNEIAGTSDASERLVSENLMEEPEVDVSDPIDSLQEEKECLLNKNEQKDCVVNIDSCNHMLNLPKSPSQDCSINVDKLDTDHVVLLPLGSVQALTAESTDV